MKLLRSSFASILIVALFFANSAAFAQQASLKSLFKTLKIEKISTSDVLQFELISTGGDTLTAAQFRGQIILMHFWATWCVPCRKELPELNALHRQFGDLPLSVIGVSIDQPQDSLAVQQMVAKLNLQFTNAAAFTGDISHDFWAWGVPVTFLVDKQGKIIGRMRGPRSWIDDTVVELLQQLTSE